MEPDYDATLVKAKTYFNKMLRDRENRMQKLPVVLPKRIKIETLPFSNSENVQKLRESETLHCHIIETEAHETITNHLLESEIKHHNLTETIHYPASENIGITKSKATKKKSVHHGKLPKLTIKSFELRTMNDKLEVNSKDANSSKSTTKSLSILTNCSPVSTSLKISTSSSTARINRKCYEAIQKAKNYFETRDTSKIKNKRSSKISQSNEINNNKKQTENIVNTVEIQKFHIPLDPASKKGKNTTHQNKQSGIDGHSTTKKNLRSQLGIDQKSIHLKKENKDKILTARTGTKIKTFLNSTRDNNKSSRPDTPQLLVKIPDIISDHLTPAKRYLRSKLGIDDKTASIMKNDNFKNISIEQNTSAKTETKTEPQPESSKHGTNLGTTNEVKVRQPITARAVRGKETNLKKIPAVNEKGNQPRSKLQMRKKGALSAKTEIVTNIEPCQETNKLSFELKRPVVLTSSKEKIIAKALKIGLKKINCAGLQDLQIQLNSSSQSSNNFTGFERCDKADLISMQSMLESKISSFQTEMERRQKQTFNKIQELENTIQFRKQQLLEVNKTKNKAMQNYERIKRQV